MVNLKDFISEGQLPSAKNLCSNNDTPMARMMEKGIARIGKPLKDIATSIENLGKLEIYKLEKNISILATVAGAAPMVGMLGTVINSLALQSNLEKIGMPSRVMTAISINRVAEPYIKNKATRHLEKGRIVIFGSGTGNPFFSTDTAASLRASEMGCSKIIKATKVNGIYDSDPNIDKNAKLIKNITYSEVISKNLRVMDLTAISLAKESSIPIYITNIFEKDSLIRALKEEGNYSKIN